MRNLLVCVPKAQPGRVAAAVRHVFIPPDQTIARTR